MIKELLLLNSKKLEGKGGPRSLKWVNITPVSYRCEGGQRRWILKFINLTEAPDQILELSHLCLGPVNTENLSVSFNTDPQDP